MTRNGLTLAVIVLLATIEVMLTGADLHLWGQTNWRARAFVAFSFQPMLLSRSWEFWPGQQAGMFFTHIFLHIGFLHMAGNVIGLALLLRLLGWMRSTSFILIGLGSALCGALTFWAFGPAAASMTGASGAISGLATFWAGRRLRQNPVRWKAIAAGVVLLVGLVAMEALPEVKTAWQAHLGGALLGLILAPTRASLWRDKDEHPDR